MEQAFNASGEVWSLLKNSGDRYIFDAVKHGYTDDWETKIPADIAVGIDTIQPHLLERRSEWNKPTPEPWALPTEIWRETIERLQRCGNILNKIKEGEICQINDFITYNLDIRSFAADLIGRTQNPHVVRHFYKALQEITILDPTCGSGAFLFAAMNILEPLYEVCIDRMQEFHEQNALLFKDELEEIEHKYRSNIQYFIFKSIILRNLYGVDIMTEATEIAKLRLFLKMVAVVEVNRRLPNLGLDPLPDIDFNIRCGNTLVGYATEEEVINGSSSDLFIQAKFREKVELEMEKVSMAYNHFRTQQLTDVDDRASFKEAKNELSSKLTALTDMLDHQLFTASGMADFKEWKSSHQPFHWIAEYYQIIHGNGGFDVIIGNPPYVSKSKINYLDTTSNFSCSDLYGYVINRTYDLISKYGNHGFIVMHNLAFSHNFKYVRNRIINTQGAKWFSFYSRIPSGLFSGDVRVRNAIYIHLLSADNRCYTTRMHRWFTEQRASLFSTTEYHRFNYQGVIPMLNSDKLQKVFENKIGLPIALIEDSQGEALYYKKVAYNWLAVSNKEPPCYDTENNPIPQSECGLWKINQNYFKQLQLLLCGKFYFVKWLTYGDDFHLQGKDLNSFVFPFDKLSSEDNQKLNVLYDSFINKLSSTVQFKRNAGKNIGTFNTKKLWDITDKSDSIFLSYIVDDVDAIMDEIENQIAVSVISDKGSISYNDVEE